MTFEQLLRKSWPFHRPSDELFRLGADINAAAIRNFNTFLLPNSRLFDQFTMEISPLAKIPCLFLVTAYHHLSYTPPNPPASAENRPVAPSLSDRLLKGMMIMHTPDFTKVRIKFNIEIIYDDSLTVHR